MAQAFLNTGYVFDALKAAKMGLDLGGNKKKALYRAGKAAYGMSIWVEAVKFFGDLLVEAPNNADFRNEHAKSKARLHESQTGEYDRVELLKAEDNQATCDMADYTGLVEIVDIPGKGKGTVLKKDVKKGTLLFAAKAYVCDFHHNRGEDLVPLAIEKLRKNPHTAKDFYAVYAGDLSRDVDIPYGTIDVERIRKICKLNVVGANALKIPRAFLWLPASFVNHSCLCKFNFYYLIV